MPYLAGSFLVARASLQDPFFTQTVILLLQHDADGAFGLVLNKPGETDEVPFPVYLGGPCTSDGVILLHGHPDWLEAEPTRETVEVAPGIYIGNAHQFQQLTEREGERGDRFRVFASYSGWGPDQLEGELASGSWAVVPATGALLFETPVDELWERLLPPSFPEPSLN